jgi:hypothetical protein
MGFRSVLRRGLDPRLAFWLFDFWLGLELGLEFDNYSERFSLVLGVF